MRKIVAISSSICASRESFGCSFPASLPPNKSLKKDIVLLLRRADETCSSARCITLYQDVKTRKIHVPSEAPPPPLRGTSPAAAGEALWAENRTSALSIAAHPVEKDSSIAKIVQIYTIGGLRASKQTLAEQVSKACDSPPTHFCRSSEARFRSVSVFRRTSTRSLAKRGVCAEHAAVTLCARES